MLNLTKMLFIVDVGVGVDVAQVTQQSLCAGIIGWFAKIGDLIIHSRVALAVIGQLPHSGNGMLQVVLHCSHQRLTPDIGCP